MLKDPKKITDIVSYLKSTPFYKIKVDKVNNEIYDMIKNTALNEITDNSLGYGFVDLGEPTDPEVFKAAAKFHMADGIEDKDKLEQILFSELKTVESMNKWEEFKTVYSMNNKMYYELIDTESTQIDAHILERLPFKTFYLDLSTLGIKHNINGRNNQLYGAFIRFEDINEQIYQLTVDLCYSYRNFYHLQYSLSKTKEVVLKATDDVVISSRIKDSEIARRTWEAEVGDLASHINEYLVITLNILLYMCSEKPDIDMEQKPKSTNKNRRIQTKNEIKQWNIGCRVGPKLFNARREYEEALTKQTGRTVRPTIRKAHWHRYWCGPKGNQHLELRWLEPIFVNCNNAEKLPVVEHNANITDKR